MLRAVAALHDIDQQAASVRLAAEETAAVNYRRLKDLAIPGYAGAWFDADSQRLAVASSDPTASKSMSGLDVDVVLVDWSLNVLQSLRDQIRTRETSPLPAGMYKGGYVDYRNNTVVIYVGLDDVAAARQYLADEAPRVTVTGLRELPEFASGFVRGADGTINLDWSDLPCSIGVSVNGGFLTAGHCAYAEDRIVTAAEVDLGDAIDSTFSTSIKGPLDSAWVQTITGWVPEAKINGYDDGVITVPAKWSGMNESPVNTTVCRYGQTSTGPFCGMVDEKDVDMMFNFPNTLGVLILGITRVTGSCTNDGDSGGPHLSAAGFQVQGTNVGGDRNSCGISPDPATHVPDHDVEIYFQPVDTAMALWPTRRMLTAHGANAPTVHGLNCFQSTLTTYFCTLDYYNSQGNTTMNWSSTGGGSGFGTYYEGNCATGSSATASVSATNSYGTGTSLNRIVHCHSIVP